MRLNIVSMAPVVQTLHYVFETVSVAERGDLDRIFANDQLSNEERFSCLCRYIIVCHLIFDNSMNVTSRFIPSNILNSKPFIISRINS